MFATSQKGRSAAIHHTANQSKNIKNIITTSVITIITFFGA